MTASPAGAAVRRTAADICRPLYLGREARGLLREGQKPIEYLRLLVEHACYLEAIRFMAQALRTRETIWWACLCVRQARGDRLTLQEREALRTAVQWVLEPSAEHQRQAHQAAKTLGLDAAAGCVAQAAGWCDEICSPRAAKIAGAAVLQAVTDSPGPPEIAYQQYLLLGLDVFDGTSPWTSVAEEGPP